MLINSAIWRPYTYLSAPKMWSQMFHFPEHVPPGKEGKKLPCKSQKLMLIQGLINPASSGIHYILPFAVRSMEKLCVLVDREMTKIGAQKMIMPILTAGHLWKTSGRWNDIANELFKLQDRHLHDFCLGPTHEEAITSILAAFSLSYKHFPLKLYQISVKFRDEMRPRYGLLRGREFYMKDMYTFDSTEEMAEATYQEVCSAYDSIFQSLGIKHIKVQASTGTIGGKLSHEYHFLSDIGEDNLLLCPKCNNGISSEMSGDQLYCSDCGSEYERKCGIEVGHSFLLGTTYSEPFKAKCISQDGQFKTLQMGCYGLGITRILAASIEILSSSENIRWPLIISPYLVSVISSKKGSKEDNSSVLAQNIAQSLCSFPFLSDNVLFDDRNKLTIGRRINDANAIGIPFLVVTGKQALDVIPKIEVIDVYKNQTYMLTHSEVMVFFRNVNTTLEYKVT